MKRLILPLLISMVIAFGGCSTKTVSQGIEQPGSGEASEQQPLQETRPVEKAKKTSPDAVQSKQIPSEAIQDRQPQKASQSESKTYGAELQSKIKDIHFDFDKYDIREDAKPVLKEFSDLLSSNRSLRVVVEGHCDSRGTEEYNLALGDRRANAAREYLRSLGIPAAKIETVSYGKEKPLCTEENESCWARNRRDRLVPMEETR